MIGIHWSLAGSAAVLLCVILLLLAFISRRSPGT